MHIDYNLCAYFAQSIQLIQDSIGQFKKGGQQADLFPERWLPATFGLLLEPFSEKNRMINSTMKMVRNKIEEAYQNRLDFLYTADGKKVDNDENIKALS